MKKKLLLSFLLLLYFFQAHAQTNFSLKLYAGSNAARGKSHYITIDSKGNCKYRLTDVRKGLLDSSSFAITRAQLSQLEEVINKIKFFRLDEKYNAQSRDGTRLSVDVSQSNKKKTVHWVNVHPPETVQLLDKLNVILASRNIKIGY